MTAGARGRLPPGSGPRLADFSKRPVKSSMEVGGLSQPVAGAAAAREAGMSRAFVIGKTSHDRGVHDARLQEHGERLMGRLGSVSRCCCTMLLILSLVSCMVSWRSPRGWISTCGSREDRDDSGRRLPPRLRAAAGPSLMPLALAREEVGSRLCGPGFLPCNAFQRIFRGRWPSSPNKRSRARERLYTPTDLGPHTQSPARWQGQLVPWR